MYHQGYQQRQVAPRQQVVQQGQLQPGTVLVQQGNSQHSVRPITVRFLRISRVLDRIRTEHIHDFCRGDSPLQLLSILSVEILIKKKVRAFFLRSIGNTSSNRVDDRFNIVNNKVVNNKQLFFNAVNSGAGIAILCTFWPITFKILKISTEHKDQFCREFNSLHFESICSIGILSGSKVITKKRSR